MLPRIRPRAARLGSLTNVLLWFRSELEHNCFVVSPAIELVALLFVPVHVARQRLRLPLHLGEAAELGNVLLVVKGAFDKVPAVIPVCRENRPAAGAAAWVRVALDVDVLETAEKATDLVRNDSESVFIGGRRLDGTRRTCHCWGRCMVAVRML